MKILREKIFFDYKEYAEKYGEEAAERIKNYRSMAAKDIADVRRDAQQYKDRKMLKAAEKLIQTAKEGTAKLEGYERGKKATEEAFNAAERECRKGRIKVAIGAAALTTAGIGYKHYKNKKKKSHAKIDEEEGKKAGFNKKKVDDIVLDAKHKTDRKTGDYNGSK